MSNLAGLGRAALLAAMLAMLGATREAVSLYNDACRLAAASDLDRSARLLLDAVKAGFDDLSHMRRDPDLVPLRGHRIYRALVDARDSADELLAMRRFDGWRTRFGEDGYRYEIDSAAHLMLVSSLDDAGHALTRQAAATQMDHLHGKLFPVERRPHLLVVVPDGDDANLLLSRTGVEGLYNHRRQELVIRSPGRALRHELVHAAHHAHMDALGQEHPLWIQEGLACLYESYELRDNGTVVFTPNDRHDEARKLLDRGDLLPWPEIFTVTSKTVGRDAGRTYPQLRTFFRFLAARGYLDTWYAAYVEHYEIDATGVETLERVLGRSLVEIDVEWRRWLKS